MATYLTSLLVIKKKKRKYFEHLNRHEARLCQSLQVSEKVWFGLVGHLMPNSVYIHDL